MFGTRPFNKTLFIIWIVCALGLAIFIYRQEFQGGGIGSGDPDTEFTQTRISTLGTVSRPRPDRHQKSASARSVSEFRQRPVGNNAVTSSTKISADQKLTLAGRVINEDGAGIPNASVTWENRQANNADDQTTITDSNGRFTLSASIFDVGFFVVSAKGYAKYRSEDVVSLGSHATGDIEMILHPGVRISGRVVDTGGRPIPNAAVSYMDTVNYYDHFRYHSQHYNTFWPIDTTDSNGYFSHDSLPQYGNLFLIVNADGYVPAKSRMDLSDGKTSPSIEVVLEPGLTQLGRVIDEQGNPLSAELYFSKKVMPDHDSIETTGMTLQDGRFTVKNLPPGKQKLTVTGKDPGWATKETEVEPNSEELVVTLNRADNSNLATVRVRILDSITREPVTQFEVASPHCEITRDGEPPNGFRFDTRPKEHLYFELAAPGYAESFFMYHLDGTTTSTVHTFELRRGNSVKGRLVTAGELRPLGGVAVNAYPTGMANGIYAKRKGHFTETNANGEFLLENLAGEIGIKIHSPEGYIAEDLYKPVSNQDIDLGTIEIQQAATLSGQFLNADGSPVRYYSVQLGGDDHDGENWRINKCLITDKHGRFTVEGLKSGPYTIGSGEGIFRINNVETGKTNEVAFEVGNVTMSGEVIYKGTPVDTGYLEVEAVDGSFMKGEDFENGIFQVSRLSPGDYKLKIKVKFPGKGDGNDLESIDAMEEIITVPDRSEFVRDFEIP